MEVMGPSSRTCPDTATVRHATVRQVLHLAGFREDAEAFASAGDVVRLRRVQHALRKQQEVVTCLEHEGGEGNHFKGPENYCRHLSGWFLVFL